MAEEPSNGELWRSLSDIKGLVQNLVGNREYVEFQRHVTHVLGELAKDIADERAAREAGFKELRAEQAAGRRTSKGAIWSAIGTLVAGIALAAFVTFVKTGGH